MLDQIPQEERRAVARLTRNALLAFVGLCLVAALLFFTVPEARAALLVAYEQMYKAMITMAVMCGFVPAPT